jgi:hypothetical protein
MNINEEMDDDFEIVVDNEKDAEDLGVKSTQELEDMSVDELSQDHFRNLVGDLETPYLRKLGSKLMLAFETDLQSRSQFDATISQGLNFMGIGFDDADVPFDGACSAIHPLLTENTCKYQAKFARAFLPTKGPYQIDVINEDVPNIDVLSKKYQRKMNYLATVKMPEFYRETEKMFLYLPFIGTGIKKVYFDPILKRPVSDFVRVENFIVNELATDLERAERFSHVFYRSVDEFNYDKEAGIYSNPEGVDLRESDPWRSTLAQDVDSALEIHAELQGTEVHTLIEMYVNLTFDDTDFESEVALPYVVTIHKDSEMVVGVRRNWYQEDLDQRKIIPFVDYTFIPNLGWMGLGLIHLLGGLEQSATAILRALVDSGSFANLQGGFKAKNLKVVGENEPHSPGEFKDVEMLTAAGQGQTISDLIMPLPFKEPSATLFQLLQYIVNSGQKFADNLEQVVSDSANYGKVGTTMALLEESTQFFTAVYNRVYRSFFRELMLIAELAERYMGDEFIADFNKDGTADLLPAADPNYPTRSHRLAVAQTKVNLALQAPQVHNLSEVFRSLYQALGESEEDIARILSSPAQAQEADPLTDIQTASNGLPIKAFPGQDHDAHIQVKTMFLQDPLAGGSDQMGTVRPVLEANIREHTVLKYIEMVKGATKEDAGIAEAAKMVSAANQQAMTNKQQGTPEMLMAQAQVDKVAIEADKLEHQKDKDAVDASLRIKALELQAATQTNQTLGAIVAADQKAEQALVSTALQLLNLTKETPPTKG